MATKELDSSYEYEIDERTHGNVDYKAPTQVQSNLGPAPDYTTVSGDELFNKVNANEQQSMNETQSAYQDVINSVDGLYQGVNDEIDRWADEQTKLQQDRSDFTIEQIEQQKDQAHKDYLKEQSGAYVDWQKQSNKYGANAEQMAASGLYGTGFSESSQVSMYNQYQNRVAVARESFQQAVVEYNNAMTEARLQNNSILAEIAHEALLQKAQNALDAGMYKNNLLIDLANKKIEIRNTAWQQYTDVLDQINTQNALAEEVRQFNASYDLDIKKLNETIRQHDADYKLAMAEFDEKMYQFDQELKRLYQADAKEHAREIEKIKLAKEELELEKKRYEEEMKIEKERLTLEKKQLALSQAKYAAGSASVSKSTAKKVASGGSAKQYKNKAVTTGVSRYEKPTIDQKSVAALGKGPMSASNLAQQVSDGRLSATQNGRKIAITSNGSLAAGQAALNKYTWLNKM